MLGSRWFWLSAALSSLVLCLHCGACRAAQAEPPALAAFQAQYDVVRNGKPLGSASLALRARADQNWEFTTRTQGTHGLAALAGAEVIEHSVFRWENGIPVLVQYGYRQQAAWRSKSRSLRAQAGRITSQDGDRTRTLPLEPSVMDRNTVLLALAHAIRGKQSSFRYRVADRGRLEWHTYQRDGDERIRVPAGEFRAQRVERVRENAGRTTEIWFAPQSIYAPLRIEQREPNGETITLMLRRLPQ